MYAFMFNIEQKAIARVHKQKNTKKNIYIHRSMHKCSFVRSIYVFGFG